jgi:hypothetical protein
VLRDDHGAKCGRCTCVRHAPSRAGGCRRGHSWPCDGKRLGRRRRRVRCQRQSDPDSNGGTRWRAEPTRASRSRASSRWSAVRADRCNSFPAALAAVVFTMPSDSSISCPPPSVASPGEFTQRRHSGSSC